MSFSSLSQGLWAAIAVDGSASFGPATASSFTWSHTVTAASNSALVVGVIIGNNNNFSFIVNTVTYNGVALTRIVHQGDAPSGGNNSVDLWVLLNPPAGAFNVVVTTNSSIGAAMFSESYSGVSGLGANFSNGSPIGTNATTWAASITTTTPNSWVTGMIAHVQTSTWTNTSTEVTRWTGGSGQMTARGFDFPTTTAGSYPANFSFDSNQSSAEGLIELLPVTGTPTFTRTITASPTASPYQSPTPSPTNAPSVCPTWVANGSAVVAAPGKNILTGENTAGNGSPEAGSIWSNATIDLNANFNRTYKVYLGNDTAGTSGIAFVLQKSGTAALGGCGPGMGFGTSSCGGTAIPTSLEVEIRSESTGGASTTGTLAIDENGATTQNGCSSVASTCPIAATAGNVKDGLEHSFQIIWTASTKVMQVYFDGTLKLTYTKDIVTSLFGGTNLVNYGFTGGTDTTGNLQYFYDPNCAITPASCTNWTLAGSAGYTAPNQIQMTPDNQWLVAAAWSPVCVNLSSDFDFNYQVYLGSNAGTSGTGGADGMAFVLQTAGTAALGAIGGALGIQGLNPSVAVEIDTYQNFGEPTYDHIAVDENGSPTHGGAGPVQASASSTDVKDGALHTFEVKWQASTKTMSVYFDGSLRLTYVKDIAVLLGATCVTYGYTGATGFKTDRQYMIDNNCILTSTPTSTASPTRTASPTPTATASRTASPTQTASPVPTATPQLPLLKSTTASSANVGDTITYCILWRNDSSASTPIVFWDSVSAYLTYVGCNSGCSVSGGVVSWSLGSQAAGSSGSACFWARVSGYPP